MCAGTIGMAIWMMSTVHIVGYIRLLSGFDIGINLIESVFLCSTVDVVKINIPLNVTK